MEQPCGPSDRLGAAALRPWTVSGRVGYRRTRPTRTRLLWLLFARGARQSRGALGGDQRNICELNGRRTGPRGRVSIDELRDLLRGFGRQDRVLWRGLSPPVLVQRWIRGLSAAPEL